MENAADNRALWKLGRYRHARLTLLCVALRELQPIGLFVSLSDGPVSSLLPELQSFSSTLQGPLRARQSSHCDSYDVTWQHGISHFRVAWQDNDTHSLLDGKTVPHLET